MAKQTINNGETGSLVRGKLNSNFTELYATTAAQTVEVDALKATALVRVNVKVDHGALGDGRSLSDLATTASSTTVSSVTAAFTSADIGKIICVEGAGVGGAPLRATISSITSGTAVVVGTAATGSMSAKRGLVATDDGPAFQEAIDWLADNGGGVLYVPPGQYLINTAVSQNAGIETGKGRAQIHLPALDLSTEEPIYIELKGVNNPARNLSWNAGMTQPLNTGGSIIHSYVSSATAGDAIFAGGPPTGVAWQHSGIYVEAHDLTFRTYANPRITPLNLRYIGGARVANLLVDSGTPLQSVVEPTNEAYCVILPGVNNFLPSAAINCDFVNYRYGLQVSEHAEIDDVRVWLCARALMLEGASHSLHIKKLLYVGCTWGIVYVEGTLGNVFFVADSVDCEHTDFGDWRDTVYDTRSGNNELKGTMNFQSVVSNTGPNGEYFGYGDLNIKVRNLYYNVDPQSYQAVGDTNVNLLNFSGATILSPNTTLTAARTWTLPPSIQKQMRLIVDYIGAISATNTIILDPTGSDTINGGANYTIDNPYSITMVWDHGGGVFTARQLGETGNTKSHSDVYVDADADAVSTSTTLASTALSIAVGPGNWQIEVGLRFRNAGAAPGWKVNLLKTGSPTFLSGRILFGEGAGAPTINIHDIASGEPNTAGVDTGAGAFCDITKVYVVASAATFTVQLAQNVSDAAQTVMTFGSFIRATKIAA